MNLKDKVGQRLMIGIRGKDLDRETQRQLKEINPGSVILFRRNISSPLQVARLVSAIKGSIAPSPLIAIDQEGGRVIRFTEDVTVFPGNMALGAAGSTHFSFLQGVASASQLREIGIDINLAPVVDVITSLHNPGITIRSFGDDPRRVADFAISFIRGTQRAGVAAVAKHFPGKGAAVTDAHIDLPSINLSRELFVDVHHYPFVRAIENGVRGIMTTHVHCPSLENGGVQPATFSPRIVNDFLRNGYRFDGVIFSDDLEMGAIARRYSIEDACRRATAAGHDMLLICSDYRLQRRAFDTLLDDYSSSRLPRDQLDASVGRITALRDFCSMKPSSDLPEDFSSPEYLAGEIARKAITIVSDRKHLLPVTEKKTNEVHLFIPDLSVLPAIERGYAPTGQHLLIEESKRCFPGRVVPHFFSLDPAPAEIERLIRFPEKPATFIVFISNAREHPGQQELIMRTSLSHGSVIVALLDNPFDCACIDPQETCLTSFGFRRTQLTALVKVIFGKAAATGSLPFRVTP